jgi:hypothetical protein
MSEKIEEPKKCLVHTGVFLTPSKTNPNRLVCQACIMARIDKMVITKRKNKKAQVKESKQPNINIPNKVELDFTPYTGIRDELLKSASVNFRSLENEILFTLNTYLKEKLVKP